MQVFSKIGYSMQFAGYHCYCLIHNCKYLHEKETFANISWKLLHCASNCVVIYFKTHWNENCAVCFIISARYSISALTNKIQREDFLEGPERSKSVYYGLVVVAVAVPNFYPGPKVALCPGHNTMSEFIFSIPLIHSWTLK